jgi:hypothetical protein
MAAIMPLYGAWGAGPLPDPYSPADTLLKAARSAVVTVSQTQESFNTPPASVEFLGNRDAAITAALAANDMFGVAESEPLPEAVAASVTGPQGQGAARLFLLVGPLTIANNLPSLPMRVLMAPSPALMLAGAGGIPLALNAVAD